MNPNDMRIALVTGASGGIGAAAAIALAEAGYDVAVHYRTGRERAEKVCEEIRKTGQRAEAFCADVAKEDEVARMIEDIRILLGDVTVLVNNAGAADIRPFSDVDSALWRGLLDVNLTGQYNCCRAVLPHMVNRYYENGRRSGIVNVSSVWGMNGASCEAAYSAAKAGVIGLTQALAKEYAPSGVRVNCVAPGCIRTAMTGGLDAEAIADIEDRTPLGRLGEPEEVARAIVFLASEEASFITGVTLPVTGGFIQ